MSLTRFISDLHLHPDFPARGQHFNAFIDDCQSLSTDLYILGDFFEYWVGKGQERLLYYDEIFNTLSTLAQSQKVRLMQGNHDFLYDPSLQNQYSIELIDDPLRIVLGNQALLLTHGDVLCTDDHHHMQYRKEVMCNPIWQKKFLSKSLAQRMDVAHEIRAQSLAHTHQTEMSIMDVADSAVQKFMSHHGCKILIHGHTHLPCKHDLYIDGTLANRFVLGSWYQQPITYLEADINGKLSLRSF